MARSLVALHFHLTVAGSPLPRRCASTRRHLRSCPSLFVPTPNATRHEQHDASYPSPELGSVDGDSNTVTPDRAVIAFLEIAQDLELYIQEVLWCPTFHQFRDLPFELRYNIYQEYLSSVSNSLTTQRWPQFDGLYPKFRKRGSAPFLPGLCLSSKALLREVGIFILAAISSRFVTLSDLMHFLDAAAQFQLPEMDDTHSVRRPIIDNPNNLRFARMSHFNGSRVSDIDRAAAVVYNRSLNVALNAFQGLHFLTITFFAPITLGYDSVPSSEWPIRTALHIGYFLDGLNMKSVLRLRALREFSLVGVSGYQSLLLHHHFKLNEIHHKNANVGNLQPLSILAEKVKGFRAHGQNVDVGAYLYWIKYEW